MNVLVTGAGPVGLTVALELRRRGVACRLVDRLPEPIPYAKAVGVQPRTMELWAAAGVLPPVLDEAVPLRGQLVYVDGAEAARLEFTMPPEVPYGFVALPQYETERLLTRRLAELGGAVERGVELVGFEQDADGVTATLRGPDGEETVRTGYLVGCDGAHSVVRKGLGLSFEGAAFAEQYMLGDVEVDWSQPPDYAVRSMRQHPGEPTDVLVAIPLPGDRRYRMSMLVPDELSAGGPEHGVEHGFTAGPAPELRHIQAVLDRLAPEPTRASALRWSSVFRISHRIVDRYGRGRVFVAGDAAHIHPPTGAQGMNTGIQDAVAVAWRLALAVEGVAADGLLDSYDAERRPVGEEVVGRTVRHAREGYDDKDPATLMLREAQLLVSYPDSPLVGEGAEANAVKVGPRPGERAPDSRGLRRDSVAFPVRLHEVLDGRRHTLLLFADRHDQLDGLAEVARHARAAAHGLLDTRLVLDGGLAVDAAPVVDGVALPTLRDAEGEFRAAYGAVGGCCYLVRPDGQVGFRAGRAAADELAEHLAHTFREPGGTGHGGG
ncbi:MAG TPA: FAD-dependent monooxygenase [Pseudonocardia sp.]|jgi:pentachlorophenol monooxygenase